MKDLGELTGIMARAADQQEEAAKASKLAAEAIQDIGTQLNLYHDLLRSSAEPGERLIKRMADAFLDCKEKEFPTYSKGGREIGTAQIKAMLNEFTRFYRERAGMK